MSRSAAQSLFALTLILVAAGLLVLNVAGYTQPLESLVLRPLAAVQGWVALRFSAVRDLLTSPRDIAALQARIAELEAENAALQQQLISLQEEVAEARVLSALIQYARSQPESRYLAAAVIGRDPSPFIRSIWISAGSDQGLTRGMPVVTERGLVGRVAEVFATVSRVQLLTDPELAVNVRLQDSRAEGILEAEVNGDLWVNLIPQDANVQPGELVLTSGLGGSYPQDIPVGRVVSVRKRDFELFQRALIEPGVDFQDLELVLVITNFQPLPFEATSP